MIVLRDRQKSADLLKAFREVRQQVQKPVENSMESVKNRRSTFSRGYSDSRKRSKSDRSKDFQYKYEHLEDTIDSFTTSDLMYFFRKKAEECGVKYVIANVKRDMGIFKKLQENYSVQEICLMIEFIFMSDQNYLDKASTQPTVLISSYCNTIYRDSILWADDKYCPSVPKPRKMSKNREWTKEASKERAKIGGWEDE